MSVGEWLNTVIQPSDGEGDEDWWSSDTDRALDDGRRPRSRYDQREREAPPPRRRDREPDDRWRQSSQAAYDDYSERERYRETNRRPDRFERRDRFEEDDDRPVRGQSRTYRDEEQRPPGAPFRAGEDHSERPRRERQRSDEAAVRQPARDARESAIDQAVAEIEARQRALDGDAAARSEARHRALDDDVGAQIKARQRALDGGAEPERSFGEREPQPLPARPDQGPTAGPAAAPLDISGLESQLRQITARIETLRPSATLETAINGLRDDLAEIGRSLTEALPRRALESLEIEVKALAQRIDHTRQSGADAGTLAGIERGLAEVREALHGLTPAESLVGFDDAVKTLAKRIDAIVARDDPATLQQLEAAIGGLRGIVSHVASNDTLTKVAEDVRALSAKVDGIANSATGLPALTAIENRIDVLSAALNASTEAGHAVPRELEKMLSGLIEKLEWVQLTHTDHTALAHLEDRIASLVKRLDVSDARLGLLEGVERGLADLLVYIEQLRGGGAGDAGHRIAVPPLDAGSVDREVADTKQTERRTPDALEEVPGTAEHVVDRLAKIESDMSGDKAKEAIAQPEPKREFESESDLESLLEPSAAPAAAVSLEPEYLVDEAPMLVEAAEVAPQLQPEPAPEPSQPPTSRRPAVARTPIDPSLPPDHPLEPGSAARNRQASAAERIAASEAAVGAKPPVIADPGTGKPDFIAAARRAAKAAAGTTSAEKSGGRIRVGSATRPKKLTERLRNLAVAAAVVAIVVGGFQIVSRLFEDGSSGTASHVQTAPSVTPSEPRPAPSAPPRLQTEPAPMPAEPPHVEAEPLEPPAVMPKTILVPGTDAPPAAGVAPADPASPATGVSPGQQSNLSTKSAPYATAINPVSPPIADQTNARVAAAPIGPPTDITGSLPKPGPRLAPPAGAPTSGDKLPVAIGGAALRAAALAGDPAAAYEVASRFADGRTVPQNSEEAAHWFEIAAKKGLAPAQFRLGTLYEKGLGVKKDLAMARDLYRSAADKGHGKAMHNLAVLYAEGAAGKPDYRTAAQWFHKAADYGIADSQYNLAILYARGVGVEQNFGESYKWFSLAAKDGDQDAAQKRDEVATHLDAAALEAARNATEQWTPLAQPADANTVKGAWDAPAPVAPAKAKARSAKTSAPDAVKVN
jgi:localization factor PodJL